MNLYGNGQISEVMAMENITIGVIVGGLALIVAFIKGVKFLKKSIKELISDLLKEQFESLNAKLTTLQEKVNDVDMSTTKNFLVARISEVERGHDLDEIGRERFWEEYEHYHKIGGNTYIQRKVDELVSEGKL